MIRVKVAYISNIPPLVAEHAFPLTGFVGLLANARNSSKEGKHQESIQQQHIYDARHTHTLSHQNENNK